MQVSRTPASQNHPRAPATGVREAPRDEIAVSSVAFDEIARYDGTVFPAARPSFLRHWIRQPQGAAFGVQGKQRLEGYGVLRACRRGGRSLPTIHTSQALYFKAWPPACAHDDLFSVCLPIS